MSSIGEGIDFSQEQQKVSGTNRAASRAHRPWCPSAPGSSGTEGGKRGERSASGHGVPTQPLLVRTAQLAVLGGAMAPLTDWRGLCAS